MKRYNLQALGNVETFLEKIPRKKKSLVINALVSHVLKSSKLDEILTTFFTDEEIKELFGNKKNSKKIVKKEESTSIKEEEKESSFKVEI